MYVSADVSATNTSVYVPTFPRRLTQNQLYAMNQIMFTQRVKETNYYCSK